METVSLNSIKTSIFTNFVYRLTSILKGKLFCGYQQPDLKFMWKWKTRIANSIWKEKHKFEGRVILVFKTDSNTLWATKMVWLLKEQTDQ